MVAQQQDIRNISVVHDVPCSYFSKKTISICFLNASTMCIVNVQSTMPLHMRQAPSGIHTCYMEQAMSPVLAHLLAIDGHIGLHIRDRPCSGDSGWNKQRIQVEGIVIALPERSQLGQACSMPCCLHMRICPSTAFTTKAAAAVPDNTQLQSAWHPEECS